MRPIIDMRATAMAMMLSLALPATVAAQPASAPAATQDQDGDLQATIAKSNAYTALMNRTLRALDSWRRYASWVDMKKGPTGKERYITYGLYSLYDVTSEIAAAEAATKAQPAFAELDGTVTRYIAAYQALAPLITRAERYYERKDYRDDGAAEGRKLHEGLVPAADAFLKERAVLDAQMRGLRKDLDSREIAAIEKREGRSARWQVRNIMISARAVVDQLPSDASPVVDMKAFEEAVAGYAAAVRAMDEFKDSGKTVPMIDSQASSWLGKVRDFRDRIAKTKGDARRARVGNDLTWLVNQYNTMVSLSDTAMRMSR